MDFKYCYLSPIVPLDTGVDLGTFVLMVGIALPILAGLYGLEAKLDKINDNTKAIKDMSRTLFGNDDRTPDASGQRRGTTNLQLLNLGEVRVSASLGEISTDYGIEIAMPILRPDLINRFTKSTKFSETERKFFGRETMVAVVSPTRMIWTLPSTDPKTCTEFIALAIKWLDSEYSVLATGVLRSFEDIRL